MPPKIDVQLHHIALEVKDLARTEWFYDRFLGRLGFRRFAREENYLAYTNGALTIWLMRPRNPRVRRTPPDPEDEVIPDHLAFRVSSRDEVGRIESDLEHQGVYPLFRTEEHPQFRPGYVSATWVDPDELALEVYTVPVAKKRPTRAAPKRPIRKAKPRRPSKRSRR